MLAVSCGTALVIACLAGLSDRAQVVGVIPNLLQVYGIVLGASETLTALVLLWRARYARDRRYAVLAATYAFSAPLIIANLGLLPGVLAPPGSFPFQSAPWTWILWHVGWGAGITAFALLPQRTTMRATEWWIGGAALGLCGVVGTVVFGPLLPALLAPGGVFTPLLYLWYVIALTVNAVAFTQLARRWRTFSTLEMWVGVSALVLTLDIGLTMASHVRFSTGFYVARTMGAISGVIVLIALLNDLVRLIRRSDALDGYAVLVDHLPHIAFVMDHDGRALFANAAWTRYTGQKIDDARVDGYRAMLHPDDRDTWIARATGDETIVRIRTAGGRERRHLVSAKGIRASTEAPSGFVISAIDIEDRARADAERDESDRRLNTFLDVVPQIVWTADATGWLDWYNPQWYTYTGQSHEEASGWGWQDVHHPDDLPIVMERWPASIATGEAFEMEFRLRGSNGEFQWFLTRVAPQRDAKGNVVRWYGSTTNIDAQKRVADRSARIAQLMQEAFLPESLPQHEGLRFDALYLPAESDAHIGGDWYDALTLPDQRILISCGDVAGHGLNAAILAGRLRQSIALAALEDADPARIIERVNRLLMLQSEETASAVVAVVDLGAEEIRYALAGHPAPIAGGPSLPAHALHGRGLLLGVLRGAHWATECAAFPSDAVAVFYTDGVTEFARDVVAAEARLCEAVDALVEGGGIARPAELARRHVMADATPRDDVAILVVQRASVAASGAADATQLLKKWRFHSSDARSAQRARRALADFLVEFVADRALIYEAELVVGEVLANTVEHAPGLVELTIDWTGERPVLVARDTGPGFDPKGISLPADPLDENGRGMFLIHALASDVSLRRSPGFGMELQCTLPLVRESAVPALMFDI